MFTQMGLDNLWKFASSNTELPHKYLRVITDNERCQCMRIFSTDKNLYLYFIRINFVEEAQEVAREWIKLHNLNNFPELELFTHSN